jgi:hypothetical protein
MIKHTLDADKDARFEAAVTKLIRRKGSNRVGGPPAPPAQDKVSAPAAPALPTARPSALPSQLPPRPDFDAIEAAARETASGRTNLMALIGQLVFGWSNNESLLIYVMMVLLQTDERSAAIVFATLNTTRARLDLVRRLALLKVTTPSTRLELDGIIERFNEASRVRNEIMHAMYTVNEQGEITHTQMMRFVEKRGRISFGERQPIDDKRMQSLTAARNELRELNRAIWDLLPRLQAAVAQYQTAGSAPARSAAS